MARIPKNVVWALLPIVIVLAARLLGPEDPDDNDQAKQALYVLDIVENGNWILPMEQGVLPATKPPLYPWLAVPTTVLTRVPTLLGCRLPSCIASLVVTWLVFLIGRERWKAEVGIAAAWIFAASHIAINLSIHIRPDMVLTACVTGALFAVHRQDRAQTKGMAALFWSAVSLSALAKGPVGPLLILGGAAAVAIDRDRRQAILRLLRSRWLLTLALPVGWFGLAYLVGGSPYIQNVVLPETLERVAGAGSRAGQRHLPGYLVPHFLAKTAPWSLITSVALVFVFFARQHPTVRNSLLPFAAWFTAGMVLLNLSAGQRQDYLLPLLPASSLLAAAVLAEPRLPAVRRLWRIILWISGVGSAVLGLLVLTEAAEALPEVGDLVGENWRTLGAALVLAGALIGFGVRSPRAKLGVGRSFFVAASGFLVLQLAYCAMLSPVARSDRGEALEEFVDLVHAHSRPADEIYFFGKVSNGLRFMLGRNQPNLVEEELFLYSYQREGSRRFVITTGQGERTLAQHWPDRLQPVLRRPYDRSRGIELVMLEL